MKRALEASADSGRDDGVRGVTACQSDGVSRLPTALKDSLKVAGRRFAFNIALIEKKYCRHTSGVVFDFGRDEFIFDENECTVDSEASLRKALRRSTRANAEGGRGLSLLSTPEVEDTEEESGKRLKRWLKLNKMFTDTLSNNGLPLKNQTGISSRIIPILSTHGEPVEKRPNSDPTTIDRDDPSEH